MITELSCVSCSSIAKHDWQHYLSSFIGKLSFFTRPGSSNPSHSTEGRLQPLPEAETGLVGHQPAAYCR